ncbi:hypothetical protein [Burkholderia vietnamiensis]|uniref:hypothetical protein n=1 Tax=Burkholderia vietnamiensis TaxID=60552 RepID=UPI0015946F35|nr:hypothetical protein [Burkholderia vietnamiensis]MDN8076725.1 hypothetical protein [Burkholderia vietnamiensis]HDR8984381.1 hypothetical protein [Burkholderia vietnamiensis]
MGAAVNDGGIQPQTWFPVVTLVIGASLKAIFDYFSDGRLRKRELEARREQRRDAIRISRADFQRATLLELQEACQQLARATGRMAHEDLVAFRTTGKWHMHRLSEETDQSSLKGFTSVSKLRVRVRDEEIRDLANTFSLKCIAVGSANTEEASDRELTRMGIVLDQLQEKIGAALRSVDDEEEMKLQRQ